MQSYTLQPGDPWSERLVAVDRALSQPGAILNAVIDQVVFPALRRRYFESGLKVRSGMLLRNITERSAPANYVIVEGNRARVGVDTDVDPVARYQLEGTLPHVIRPKRAKALVFTVGGRKVVAKRVQHPGTPARLIYRLEPADLRAAQAVVDGFVKRAWSGQAGASGPLEAGAPAGAAR